ncbi:MAG TPA: response regulator [Pyrinomonadaceae bacterium]|jgi:DNA-binding response OmpR family regulator
MNTKASRPAVILYVEENRALLETVRDVLEFAGWYVRRFDVGLGYALIESPEHFDLLLIDRDLRGCDGLALVRRARQLAHRRGTPIIVISLEDCAGEAVRAGADAFLRKPNNLIGLVDTIRRLLAARVGA